MNWIMDFEGNGMMRSFKAQFMIYNQSLFKWDKDAENERDYTNFHYIGNAFELWAYQVLN